MPIVAPNGFIHTCEWLKDDSADDGLLDAVGRTCCRKPQGGLPPQVFKPLGSSLWDNPLGLEPLGQSPRHQQQVEYTELPKAIASDGVSPQPTRQLDCPTSKVSLQTREHFDWSVFQTKFFQQLHKTLFAQILSHHHQYQDPLIQSVCRRS